MSARALESLQGEYKCATAEGVEHGERVREGSVFFTSSPFFTHFSAGQAFPLASSLLTLFFNGAEEWRKSVSFAPFSEDVL